MKVEGQRVFGRATGQYQRSARVNRQLQGRAARLSTFEPFVIGGSIGNFVIVGFPLLFPGLHVQSGGFDLHTFGLMLLFVSGVLIHSIYASKTFSALTHELTESGGPAGYLASPAGFISLASAAERMLGISRPVKASLTMLPRAKGRSQS